MIGSKIIIVFIIFLLSYIIIILATCFIKGDDYNSYLYVGKDKDFRTNIPIPTNTRVCLEVNTHKKTLDYFINGKHVKNRTEHVPKDVYFGV
jgi:hypothetical protein